ncbi:TPA: phage tail assembly chaperone G [Staphylococcus aureus]
MIKFELKNKETGKNEVYKKEAITVGEAEAFFDYLEESENVKSNKEARQKDRAFIVALFAEQGLTEEDLLKNLGMKAYRQLQADIFREITGESEENTEDEAEETGKTAS